MSNKTAAQHVIAAEDWLAQWGSEDSHEDKMRWAVRSIAESLIALNKRQEEDKASRRAARIYP